MPPVRPVDGAVRGVAESFVPEKTYPWGGGEYIVCAAPTHGNLPRDERLMKPPHHTGHGPFRTRPSNLIKSKNRSCKREGFVLD